ncbi:MAG: protein kinase [Myxococcales bacterium]|nr:protein kinase [Myxococcales bacterium]
MPNQSWPDGVPRVGETLDGKYRIDRIVGEGGMGIVLAATHLHLDEKVAIKVLLPELAKVPEVVTRFVREGRAAVKIKSEHVARVHDVTTLASGQPYMVMELLSGVDLGALLASHGRLPAEDAIGYVLQAAEALAEAHSKGIVHRDLKPANLFLAKREDGTLVVKVLDFGISKLLGAGDEHMSMTKSRSMLGSPLYMSPEQLTAARDVDARADIWALGVILFELVAGEPPFDANTVAELGARVLGGGGAPTLASVRPDVDERLSAVVARCLEKERGRRYASIGELVEALAPLANEAHRSQAMRLARRSSAALPDSTRLATMTEPAAAPAAALGEAPTQAAKTGGAWSTGAGLPARRRPLVLVGAVLAAAGLVIVAASVVSSRSPAAAHPEPASPLSATAAVDAAATPATTAAAAASVGTSSESPSPSGIASEIVLDAGPTETATPTKRKEPRRGPRPARPATSDTPIAAPVVPPAPSRSDRFD